MPRNLTLQKSWKDMEQGNIKAIVEELKMGGGGQREPSTKSILTLQESPQTPQI